MQHKVVCLLKFQLNIRFAQCFVTDLPVCVCSCVSFSQCDVAVIESSPPWIFLVLSQGLTRIRATWANALTVTAARSPYTAGSTSRRRTTLTASLATTACSPTPAMSAKSWLAMIQEWVALIKEIVVLIYSPLLCHSKPVLLYFFCSLLLSLFLLWNTKEYIFLSYSFKHNDNKCSLLL